MSLGSGGSSAVIEPKHAPSRAVPGSRRSRRNCAGARVSDHPSGKSSRECFCLARGLELHAEDGAPREQGHSKNGRLDVLVIEPIPHLSRRGGQLFAVAMDFDNVHHAVSPDEPLIANYVDRLVSKKFVKSGQHLSSISKKG